MKAGREGSVRGVGIAGFAVQCCTISTIFRKGEKRGRESCAAFNAACLAGESPALGDCLFDQVVMSGLGGGDESQGSPDVKGPWDSSVLGRGVPVGTGAKQPRGMQHKANIAAPSDPPQGAD